MPNVVVYKDDVPYYELTGDEIIFPIPDLDQGGVRCLAHFVCDAQYRPYEVKKFLDDMMSSTVQAEIGDSRSIEFGDEAECHKFVSSHVQGVIGVAENVDLELLKAFLDENPNIKTKIFRDGYDGILRDDQVEESVKRTLVIRLVSELSFRFKRKLYCPKREAIVDVRTRFVTAKETEMERIRWKKALKISSQGRRQNTNVEWDVLEQLYDHSAIAADGFLIEGELCTAENKAEWIGKIPLLDKLALVNRKFGMGTVKNA